MSSTARTGKFHVPPISPMKRMQQNISQEPLISASADQLASSSAASSSYNDPDNKSNSSGELKNKLIPPSWSGNVIRRKVKGRGISDEKRLDPVFKMPLQAVMVDQGQGYIPYIVQKCFHFISKYLQSRGLFRINGSMSVVEKLVEAFDSGKDIRIEDYTRDPNDVCSLLKRFISELPEPIFNQKLTESLIATLNDENSFSRLSTTRDICDTLDEYSHALLECLFYFLRDVSKHSDKNKMNVSNLATVFGPILTQQPDATMVTSFKNIRNINEVIYEMIDNANFIFGIKELSGNFADYYDVGEELGSGGFAVVYLVTEKSTGQKFAAKVIKKNKLEDVDMRRITDEINILRRVRHPNIISLRAVAKTKSEIILVMELAEGGELFDKLIEEGQYTESDASRILRQIILAVEYLHSLNIAHRDLKPENILLKDKNTRRIKIADFGLSKVFSDVPDAHTYCGTPNYVAPEVLFEDVYGMPVDMWSIGVVGYVLLGGEPPFHSNNMKKLFELIKAAKYDFDSECWDGVSDEAKDFISKLLVRNPANRLTATEALKHPFLSKRSKTLDSIKKAGLLEREQKLRKEQTKIIQEEPGFDRGETVRPEYLAQIHAWKNVRIKIIKECAVCKSYMYPFYRRVYSCQRCGVKCHEKCVDSLNSKGCKK